MILATVKSGVTQKMVCLVRELLGKLKTKQVFQWHWILRLHVPELLLAYKLYKLENTTSYYLKRSYHMHLFRSLGLYFLSVR